MRTVAFRRTRATAPGENKGEKENLSTPLMNSERLKDFRQAAYDLLVLAKNATFELMDAVMTTRNAAGLAEFSLNPLFNRQWQAYLRSIARL